MYRIKIIIFLLITFFLNTVFAQQNQYILALSKADKQLHVYNYKTLDIVTKINVGDDPHEIVTNPNGTLAYISKPLMNDKGHEIAVVNLQTLQAEKTIDTKPFYIPHGLVYLNNQLWFTAQGSKIVGVYDINSQQVTQVLGTGQDFTHLLQVSPNGKRFFTTNVESGTLSIYELKELPPYMPPTGVLPPNAKPRTEWRQTLINVGFGAEGFDITADEKELWTARPDGHLIVVDVEKKEITQDIDTKTEGLHRVKINPDGKTVVIVSVKTGDLLFYNTQTKKLEYKMQVEHGAGLFIDANNRLFVSCTSDNYIAVIDLNTKKEIKRMDIGRPDGVTAVKVSK